MAGARQVPPRWRASRLLGTGMRQEIRRTVAAAGTAGAGVGFAAGVMNEARWAVTAAAAATLAGGGSGVAAACPKAAKHIMIATATRRRRPGLWREWRGRRASRLSIRRSCACRAWRQLAGPRLVVVCTLAIRHWPVAGGIVASAVAGRFKPERACVQAHI